VELNSFESWTGGCLFSWGEDRETLLNGPLQFRLVEQPPPIDSDDYISIEWKKVVLNELKDFVTENEDVEEKENKEGKCIVS
jgi:hypothetical protein